MGWENGAVGEKPQPTAALPGAGEGTPGAEAGGSEGVNSAGPGRCSAPLPGGRGSARVHSAGRRGVPDSDSEGGVAGLAAAAAAAKSAGDGTPWKVVNEEESADVLLENEAELENMKLGLLTDGYLTSV